MDPAMNDPSVLAARQIQQPIDAGLFACQQFLQQQLKSATRPAPGMTLVPPRKK